MATYSREMRAGDSWVYRERPHDPDCPVARADILQIDPQRRGKVRVRLNGAGFRDLDAWVPKVRLRVPWQEKKAWLRDEQALLAARRASRGAEESIAYQAAEIVFEAYPRADGILIDWPRGAGTICIFEPVAVAADLGLDGVQSLPADALAFVDRLGVYYAPASVAERLARLVAERYPEQALAAVAEEERRLYEEVSQREMNGEPAEALAERQLALDPVRQWCGRTAARRFDRLTALRDEVRRLRGLVHRAAQALEEGGRLEFAAELREEAEAQATLARQGSAEMRLLPPRPKRGPKSTGN